MSRANKGGWDFVKVNETYQFKEDSMIAKVTILEDNSDEGYYRFKLRVENSNLDLSKMPDLQEFDISHVKDLDGYYSGMLQLYENDEYGYSIAWQRPEMKVIR